MKRRDIIGAVAGLVLAPTLALSQGLADRIAIELQRQGFTEIQTGTTLLGRGRVVAVGPEGQREIIFNPRTGEILRDYLRVGRSGGGTGILGSGRDDRDSDSSGSGSGGSGGGDDRDDDDNDDDNDDDSDDDSSGSGSDDSDDDSDD